MRLPFLLAVMIVSCAPASRPTPEVMPEVAAQFGEIVNDWDEGRMLALFSEERRTRGSSSATFTWLHAQLGDCGAPQFMWSFANRGARFSYPCERGTLDAGFMLDEAGKIVDIDGGAAGIPAPEMLQSAAEAVLASLPEGVDSPRPFRHEWSSAAKLGKCRIVRPWTVRELVAVFHSECESGEAALLTVRLEPDGTIAYASLVRSATIYHGPAVWLPESPARPASEALPEIAAEFGAMVNAWDEARLLALYAPKARATVRQVAWRHHAWLHEQLGACGEPQMMWSLEDRGARYTYPCERGALEAAFVLDRSGKIVDSRSGAAGIPAPDALQSAAEAVVASLPWREPTSRPFTHNLDGAAITAMGKCELVRPWVTGREGALFHVVCEHGDAGVLRIGVQEDGTISAAEMLRAADVYFGPPVGVIHGASLRIH